MIGKSRTANKINITFNMIPMIIIGRNKDFLILNAEFSYASFSFVGNFHKANPKITALRSNPTNECHCPLSYL